MSPAIDVDIEPVDIEPYERGNTGIPYLTTLDSGRPGPHVMVSAVVHGNELCGAIVLDFLHRAGVRPLQGRLTLAFMNVDAYLAFDPRDPGASRFVDEDFNRLWSAPVLDGPRDSVELRRARAVRAIVDDVDLLFDIHSMSLCPVPLSMAGLLDKGRALAVRVGVPERVVCDPGHAAGTRLRDYAAFGDPASSRNAVLVECGRHWDAATVDTARASVLRFLAVTGTVDAGFAARHGDAGAPVAPRVISVSEPVTVGTDRFRFARAYVGMEEIERAGTVIGWDGDEPVRTPYDRCVLVMPSRRPRSGESAVRFGRYVK